MQHAVYMLKFAKTQETNPALRKVTFIYSFVQSHVLRLCGQFLAILNKKYVHLPLRDEVCADSEDRRGSAIDLGAVQAAFGTVHLHSTKPRQQQPSKLLRPLLLNTQSSLGHPRSSEIG